MVAVDQRFDLARNLFCKNDVMVMFGFLVDGVGPFAFILVVGFGDQGPQINATGQGGFECLMRRVSLKTRAGMGGKAGVDQLQNGRGRPKGIIQTAPLKNLSGIKYFLLEQSLLMVKFARIGPLERIDRLLFVTHNKQRPRIIFARAIAAIEFIGKPFDHVPLAGAGVLGFVHQDMIDPAVNSVQNPCRDGRIGQQTAGLQDQIIKIQPAAFLFFQRIAF